MDIRVIRLVAPPTPACFHDRLSWSEYLASAMDSKLHKTRHNPPFINGRFNDAFSFCADCMPSHRAQMCREKRCHPPVIASPRPEVETT